MNASVNVPREIGVAIDSPGEPITILSDHCQRRVAKVRNCWRVDDDWWRSEISRMYYELLLSDGSMLTVFRDLLSGKWYQQRY
jgi:hypothetical protein